MYDAFIGRKGSGKSYNVVKTVILPQLEKGRTVVTNIPLTDEVDKNPKLTGTVIKIDIDHLPDDFFAPENVYKGAVYVLDEIHKRWSSGMKVNNMNPHDKQFITEHRHYVGEDGYSTDLILVTQDTRQLAAYPRNLLDKTYRCRKYDAIGKADMYRVDVYDGCVSLEYRASDPKIKSYHGNYDPEIFKYYKSHSQNESFHDAGLEEQSAEGNIFKSNFFRFILPFALIFALIGAYYFYSFFSSMGVSGQSDGSQNSLPNDTGSQNTQTDPQPQQAASPKSGFDFSAKYRLSHYSISAFGRVAVVTDNTHYYPIPLTDCKRVPLYGFTCNFFGQLVNFYSGEVPSYEKDTAFNPLGG
ncbi:zonular occludens toxin domain-containing protein [Thiomicrorhabdus cannonii]|uniref:zonular occludens toxin domain-containing protein n=1 Tax=Thiomicrorhabdus cannonii TaxID=2748011 RepID=UPI0015BA6698|nr:zonular occludens toxin domain-containing protein [Thiomicrorhabdus cannonii]